MGGGIAGSTDGGGSASGTSGGTGGTFIQSSGGSGIGIRSGGALASGFCGIHGESGGACFACFSSSGCAGRTSNGAGNIGKSVSGGIISVSDGSGSSSGSGLVKFFFGISDISFGIGIAARTITTQGCGSPTSFFSSAGTVLFTIGGGTSSTFSTLCVTQRAFVGFKPEMSSTLTFG